MPIKKSEKIVAFEIRQKFYKLIAGTCGQS